MNEPTHYGTDGDNPAGVEWSITVRPEPHGFSIDITNKGNQARRAPETNIPVDSSADHK